jgi:hypothetical protein
MRRFIAGCWVATLVAACGPTLRVTSGGDVALGKVVVYRNAASRPTNAAPGPRCKLIGGVPAISRRLLKSLTRIDANT